MVLDFSGKRKLYIHFVGIGGISMSGIARILLNRGHRVSGSDRSASSITEKLKARGAYVYEGHSREHISDPDLVVYTSAVDQSNPELEAAREKGIETIDRASMLGILMEEYQYTVAIAGAHGKTTTTSMVSLIIENAGLDPTLLIGGELDRIGGNVKVGKSPYLVTEACEYKENFLKFHPYAAVVLNIDRDHLDFFRGFDHIKSAFERFVRLVPDYGWVVAYHGDPAIMEIVPRLSCNVITYGTDEGAQVTAKNTAFDASGCAGFDLYIEGQYQDRVKLAIPGEHNVLNALAAISVGRIFEINMDIIKTTLADFTGTHRRFEIKGRKRGFTVVDDYAHHPAEIKATLAAAANFPHKSIWCVFQPHTYTRTKLLLDEFAECFNGADRVIITDIYAAREKDTGEIHSSHLVKAVSDRGGNAVYISGFEEVAGYLSENLQEGDLLLTVGAGDVYKIGEMLLEGNY